VPVEREANRVGGGGHGGGADGPRAAGAAALREDPEELDGHLGRRPGAGGLVIGWLVHVEHGVKIRVERGEHRVSSQRGVVEPFHPALVEQEGRPQPVLLDQAFGDFRERDPVRGGQRLRVPAGHRQGDVRAVPLVQDAQHPADEGRVQERHVGRADEGGFGLPAQRGEPGGDPLHRSLARARVLDHGGARRQAGQILARGADDHDRAGRRARHDPDRPVQERGPVPFERRLRRAHPR
jgi:hypothetical protein